MKCIGKKCEYCYDADFYDFCYVCGSQKTTFLKSDYKNHDCTIFSEIAIEERQLQSKKNAAEYIKSKQH